MAGMDAPNSPPAQLSVAADLTLPLAWGQLLEEMREVHAKLEYLRLILKLNTGPH